MARSRSTARSSGDSDRVRRDALPHGDATADAHRASADAYRATAATHRATAAAHRATAAYRATAAVAYSSRLPGL